MSIGLYFSFMKRKAMFFMLCSDDLLASTTGRKICQTVGNKSTTMRYRKEKYLSN